MTKARRKKPLAPLAPPPEIEEIELRGSTEELRHSPAHYCWSIYQQAREEQGQAGNGALHLPPAVLDYLDQVAQRFLAVDDANLAALALHILGLEQRPGHGALQSYQQRRRDISIWMRHESGDPVKRIAHDLGITPAAVYASLARAEGKIKRR